MTGARSGLAEAMKLNRVIATLDAILDSRRADIARDYTAYRHHAYRIANFALSLAPPGPEVVEKIAVTAAFHDLGIWTDHTFDYLAPSVRLAADWLAANGRSAWIPEITEIILQHHKLTPWRGDPGWLVEPFRRADWADVTHGLAPHGVPRSLIRAAYAEWPGAGFHWRLVQLEAGHLRRHPLNPLPVFRL